MCERHDLFHKLDKVELVPYEVYNHLLCEEAPCPGKAVTDHDLVYTLVKASDAIQALQEVIKGVDQEVKKRCGVRP